MQNVRNDTARRTNGKVCDAARHGYPKGARFSLLLAALFTIVSCAAATTRARRCAAAGTERAAPVVMTEPESEDWQRERGGRIDPLRDPESPMDGGDRIDQAIAESFPASDPPSFNSGVDESENESGD
jgi:hypothetical protein